MRKVSAWILFIGSVICFAVGFRTQQITVAAEQWQRESAFATDQTLFELANAAGADEPEDAPPADTPVNASINSDATAAIIFDD